MAKRKSPEWAVLDGDGIFCRRCGAREKLFPAVIGGKRGKALLLTVEAFQDEHAKCKETAQSPSVRQAQSPAHWLEGGDTGTSSITICRVLGGIGDRTRVGWPFDPADFGRCYRLLKLFPAWCARMPEVATAYPNTPWVPYVREWERMTALYEEELPSGTAPKLYALMQSLQREVKP